MTIAEAYDSLRTYLPADLHRRAVIAGGFAACPEKATDIDVWILGCDPITFNEHDELRCAHLAFNNIRMAYRGRRANEYLGRRGIVSFTEIPGDANPAEPFTILTEGPCAPAPERTIQILCTVYKTPRELIDTFDISTHAVATNGRQWWYGNGWTRTTEQPRVQYWGTPGGTLERLKKICARFGFAPDPQELERLTVLAESEAVVDGLAA